MKRLLTPLFHIVFSIAINNDNMLRIPVSTSFFVFTENSIAQIRPKRRKIYNREFYNALLKEIQGAGAFIKKQLDTYRAKTGRLSLTDGKNIRLADLDGNWQLTARRIQGKIKPPQLAAGR